MNLLAALLTLTTTMQPGGAPSAKAGYMPQAEILQCLRDRQEVDALNLEMSQEKTALDATATQLQMEQNQIDSSGQQLAAQIRQRNIAANQGPPPPATPGGNAQLDRYLRQYSGVNGARRKHNKSVSGHQQKLNAHNARIDNYNLRLNGLRQRAQIVDRHCAGAKVRPEDLAAAKARLAAEGAAAVSAPGMAAPAR